MVSDGLVVHVLAARPNFVKAAPVIHALQELDIEQHIIHTGQHYDSALSDVFFADLSIPEPAVNLGVGSSSHAAQTAALLTALEPQIVDRRPTLVVIYGDVNSTLAAALVCAKLAVPFAHVEAGLRSFDRTMPEEINRLVVDSLADLLFATSPEAVGNLGREGIDPRRVHLVGNSMIDSLYAALPALDFSSLSDRLDLPSTYGAVTLHRPSNVDDDESAAELVCSLHEAAALVPLIIPLHPRGRERFTALGLGSDGTTRVVDPLGYRDFLCLLRHAAVVITDSGGVQEETTVLGVPCLTARANTERPITISHGTNQLVTPRDLPAAVDKALIDRPGPALGELPPLWDGRSGSRIGRVISDWLTRLER